MKPINDWHGIQAAGEFEQVELGGHVLKVIKAEAKLTSTNKESLLLYLDIAEGKQKDFYRKQYENSTRTPKRWGCQYTQLTEGKSAPYFKGVITAFEKSNPGYKWNWEETTLKDKLIGGVFGREEYINDKGEKRFSIKCVQLRSTENIKSVPAPADKLLKATNDDFADFTSASESDLPWLP